MVSIEMQNAKCRMQNVLATFFLHFAFCILHLVT